MRGENKIWKASTFKCNIAEGAVFIPAYVKMQHEVLQAQHRPIGAFSSLWNSINDALVWPTSADWTISKKDLLSRCRCSKGLEPGWILKKWFPQVHHKIFHDLFHKKTFSLVLNSKLKATTRNLTIVKIIEKNSVLVSHSAVRQQSSFFSQAARPRKSSSALRHEKLLESYNLST